jgi:hypothetical protein
MTKISKPEKRSVFLNGKLIRIKLFPIKDGSWKTERLATAEDESGEPLTQGSGSREDALNDAIHHLQKLEG